MHNVDIKFWLCLKPNQIWNHSCSLPLQWRHNERDGVSNHQPHDYLLNCLFGCRSRNTSTLPSLAFVWVIHQWLVKSPHKWPVTRKMFPFDDVIMTALSKFGEFTKITMKKDTNLVWPLSSTNMFENDRFYFAKPEMGMVFAICMRVTCTGEPITLVFLCFWRNAMNCIWLINNERIHAALFPLRPIWLTIQHGKF